MKLAKISFFPPNLWYYCLLEFPRVIISKLMRFTHSRKKSLHWELLHMQFYNQKIIKKKKNLQDSDFGSFWK